MMGWCPNANTLASKRVLFALPYEEFQSGKQDNNPQKYGEISWANIYRNYILLLTSVGIVGFAATSLMIKYMFEGFHFDVIIKAILLGIVFGVFGAVQTWKGLNQINQTKIQSNKKIFLKSLIYNALLMATVLYSSFTIGKESPVEFMMFTFFPNIWIGYPLVVYWERKNRKTIYLVEEKFMRWRPVALPLND